MRRHRQGSHFDVDSQLAITEVISGGKCLGEAGRSIEGDNSLCAGLRCHGTGPLGTIAAIWRVGCIIRSQFLDLIISAFSKPSAFGDEIRSLKWKLWHGQVDRAIEQLEGISSTTDRLRKGGDLVAARVWHLAQPLLTYIRLNKNAIIDCGACYRSGRRISTALAESAVNSVTGWRMAKLQQMRWSRRGAHLMLQVRAAVMNGTLREQLRYEPPMREFRPSAIAKPIPPLFRSVGNPG